ncbi:MAG: hypothetical protein VCA36_05290 [Opitutales bacterium]
MRAQSFVPSNRFLWLLRWMVTVQCVGYAAQLAGPSSLNAWLLDSLGDPFVSGLDAWVSAFLWSSLVALPLLGVVRPIGTTGRPWPFRCDVALLGFAATWALTEAIFSWWANIGNPFNATDPYGHAARYVAPFALLVLWSGRGGNLRTEWILRLAVAGTFVGHGLCSWWMNPEFLDLIIGTMDAILGEDWEAAGERQVIAEEVLTWIAVQDFVFAGLLVLPKRLRWVALWMAIWGFVAALSRLTAFGWERWHELFVRICNGGIPLLLWIHWRRLPDNPKVR